MCVTHDGPAIYVILAMDIAWKIGYSLHTKMKSIDIDHDVKTHMLCSRIECTFDNVNESSRLSLFIVTCMIIDDFNIQSNLYIHR
jgi:hypothetical protein